MYNDSESYYEQAIRRINKDKGILPYNKQKLIEYDIHQLNKALATRGKKMKALYRFAKRVAKIGNKRFNDLNKEDFVKIISDLNLHCKSPNSFNVELIEYKCFWRFVKGLDKKCTPPEISWAENRRNINKTPVLADDLICREDVYNMISVAENLRDRAIIETLYFSAMRAGEFLNIKVGDVLFTEGGVSIRISGKTGARQVFIPQNCCKNLELWLTQCHPLKDKLDSPLWVVNFKCHKRLSKNSVAQIIKRIGKRAGIQKRLWCHLFRHSRLTELKKRNMDNSYLMLLAGWKNVKMSEVYCHLSASTDLAEKLKDIEAAM